MAEPSIFPEEHVAEPIAYRRISGFAIAGLAVAVLFVILLAVQAFLGLRSKTPVFLPAWTQAIAIVAAILCVVAVRVIRTSDDTLAGVRLAQWGLWLSVVSCLGYWAYYGATYFAVRQQADEFTMRWFDKLRNGKSNAAFLDTLPVMARQTANPENESEMRVRFEQGAGAMRPGGRGPLGMFRDNPVVRLVLQGSKEAEITPLGVRDLDYVVDAQTGYYKVKRAYQVRSPEGTFEVLVTVNGTESKSHEFAGRSWQVVSQELALDRAEPSPEGIHMIELSRNGKDFVDQWGKRLAAKDFEGAYLDTRLPEERDRLVRVFHARRLAFAVALNQGPAVAPGAALGRAVAGMDAELARRLFYPDYNRLFGRGELVRTDDMQEVSGNSGAYIRAGIRAMTIPGMPPGMPRFAGLMAEDGSGRKRWQIENDRVLMPYDCKFGFPAVDGSSNRFFGDGTITIESEPGAIRTGQTRAWRIREVDFYLAGDANQGMEMATGEGGPANMGPNRGGQRRNPTPQIP